jgi:hypothetical protein
MLLCRSNATFVLCLLGLGHCAPANRHASTNVPVGASAPPPTTAAPAVDQSIIKEQIRTEVGAGHMIPVALRASLSEQAENEAVKDFPKPRARLLIDTFWSSKVEVLLLGRLGDEHEDVAKMFRAHGVSSARILAGVTGPHLGPEERASVAEIMAEAPDVDLAKLAALCQPAAAAEEMGAYLRCLSACCRTGSSECRQALVNNLKPALQKASYDDAMDRLEWLATTLGNKAPWKELVYLASDRRSKPMLLCSTLSLGANQGSTGSCVAQGFWPILGNVYLGAALTALDIHLPFMDDAQTAMAPQPGYTSAQRKQATKAIIDWKPAAAALPASK